jgi:hypothetical protein
MFASLDEIRTSIERLLPPDVVTALREEGIALTLSPSIDPERLVDISDELAERELVGDMVNYRKEDTGVANTIFISQRGYTKHGPRIKVAIDPADSIDATSKTISVSIITGKVVAGDETKLSAARLKDVQSFIELNRQTLLDYWNVTISTKQLGERLISID